MCLGGCPCVKPSIPSNFRIEHEPPGAFLDRNSGDRVGVSPTWRGRSVFEVHIHAGGAIPDGQCHGQPCTTYMRINKSYLVSHSLEPSPGSVGGSEQILR